MLICEICHINETENTSGTCWKCFYRMKKETNQDKDMNQYPHSFGNGLFVSEDSKELARKVIEKISPNNNGIRAVNSGMLMAIEIIEEVFDLTP